MKRPRFAAGVALEWAESRARVEAAEVYLRPPVVDVVQRVPVKLRVVPQQFHRGEFLHQRIVKANH